MKKSKKGASNVTRIETGDGPTSVFILKKPEKYTLKQQLQRLKHKIRKYCVEKTIKCEPHSMDETADYIVNKCDLAEVDRESGEFINEYTQMRASFIIQYAPELLGEYAEIPKLKGESAEDIKLHIEQAKEQMKRAMEVPQSAFDIDMHKFKKVFSDVNDNIHIDIEKKYGYIGGGCSGGRKVRKEFNRIYKGIYRYYGVTREDIQSRSKRYVELVRTLSR